MQNGYSSYEHTHRNFVNAYRLINEYVAGIYLTPQKLAEDAGKVLDNFSSELPGEPSKGNLNTSCELVIDFMDQLDEYTVQTIQLFNEHKKHVEVTSEYLKKASSVTKAPVDTHFGIPGESPSNLAPELDTLMDGLREIKNKADGMAMQLQKLELRWEGIKVSI